jgi:hypothetical protein
MFFAASDAAIFAPIWLAWLVGFVVIELVALKRGKATDGEHGGTLSEVIWRLKRTRWVMVVLGLFWAMLTYHFFFDSGA